MLPHRLVNRAAPNAKVRAPIFHPVPPEKEGVTAGCHGSPRCCRRLTRPGLCLPTPWAPGEALSSQAALSNPCRGAGGGPSPLSVTKSSTPRTVPFSPALHLQDPSVVSSTENTHRALLLGTCFEDVARATTSGPGPASGGWHGARDIRQSALCSGTTTLSPRPAPPRPVPCGEMQRKFSLFSG